MSKKDDLALVPKYRFPEFKDGGEWEEKKIGTFGEIINGLSGKKSTDFGSGEPYIQYKQVFDKSYINFSECGKVSIKNNEKQNAVQKGDILFTTSSETSDEVGFASVVINKPHQKTYLNSFCFILRPFDLEKTISSFSRFLFQSSIYRKSVSAIAQGSTRYNLSKVAFLKLKIPIPLKPEEQQKIADCLSSIDDLISAEEKKLSLLNDYKKGWMQKLFPAEGKNVPEWRFPEFQDSGEWAKATIGEIADYENGKAHENDIMDNGKYIVVNSKFISTEGEIIKYTNVANLLAYKGDVLMVLSDVPNGRALSKCYLVEKDNVYTVNQRVCRITPRKVNSILLFYTINRNKYFLSFDDGVKQTNLRKNDVLSCSIFIPKEPKEQAKIANFLSGIDDLISKQTGKIEALKHHKKALMQGLFPTVEEILK